MIYTKDEMVLRKASQSSYFSDLEELWQACELESRRSWITSNQPFQIGIALYQPVKLRMLDFSYDSMDRHVDRRVFKVTQMGTDSNFIAISAYEEHCSPRVGGRIRGNKAVVACMGERRGSSNSNVMAAR